MVEGQLAQDDLEPVVLQARLQRLFVLNLVLNRPLVELTVALRFIIIFLKSYCT